jgi:putative inorganic carbon (HCO3(-)) transporter
MGEAAGTVAVMLAVLALSQSRSAWFAASLALAIVAVLRFRTLRLLAVAAVAIGVCAWPGELSATVGRMLTSPGSFTMEARLELWSRALFATGHFPATGMGLNAFREVAPALYPLIIIQTQRDLAHSHNTFLQVALDAGLIGLIAYVALLLLAWTLGGWVARRTAGPASVVAVGACGNLLAIHLFGLTDAIALGAKVGLFLWITLGLIEALWAQHGARLALATADVGRSARSLQTS